MSIGSFRILLAIICLYFGILLGPVNAQWLSPGPNIPDVALMDDNGRTWNLKNLVRDRPVLISFFFTGCATICPPQTATMRDVRDELAQRSLSNAEMPLLLSISLDPIGDSPQAVKNYAKLFKVEVGVDKGWIMLTGSPSNLQRVWQAFDQPDGSPTEHPAMLWVGQPKRDRWTRTSGLGAPAPIADLLLEGSG